MGKNHRKRLLSPWIAGSCILLAPVGLSLAAAPPAATTPLASAAAAAAAAARLDTSEFAVLPLNCGTAANRDCDQAIVRINTLVEDRIRQQVFPLPPGNTDGLYNLKDLLQLPKPGSDPNSGVVELETSKQKFTDICSLNGNRFNEMKAEENSNFLGKSCGKPDTIECRTSSLGELRVQLITGTGTRERSHMNGVFLEALSCVLEEIKQEISTARELKLYGNDKNNPCQSFLTKYSEATSYLQKESEKASAESRTLCKFTKNGLPEQSGCYARAAIETLDALYATVAVCEAFRRSNQAFAEFADSFYSPESRQKHWLELSKECTSKSSCEAFSTCYHDKYRALMKSKSLNRFPANGTGKCGRK